MKGQIISGKFGELCIRQKSNSNLEIGELLIAESKDTKILLHVYDLFYGSQMSQQNLELISGMALEEDDKTEFFEPELRNYMLANAKPLIHIHDEKNAILSKALPDFFSGVREVTKDDLKFLTQPNNPLYIGKLRSGSRMLDVDIFLEGKDVFSHHILIPATTGKGKSNLMSCMLWSCVDKDYCGMLVLDPHDEYYGRTGIGLKDHSNKEKVVYYSISPPPGCRSLKINIKNIKPAHFYGAFNFSDPQKQALQAYFRKFGDGWIEAILLEKTIDVVFQEGTMAVVKRRLVGVLGIDYVEDRFVCNSIFDFQAGETTISDICSELEKSSTVIIDTSIFSSQVEILIGSLITNEIFGKYKRYKSKGELKDKPVISIVLEEAPRVLGKEVLERGPNVFSSIAREGRKFKIGLTAITQLPSLIPREILANMNTKIILGLEMKPERQAIIESAAQDLSDDDRNIASLDKGEAIITSNFARFATPIKIPLFKDIVDNEKKTEVPRDFSGVGQ
jgi:hypothetical protein